MAKKRRHEELDAFTNACLGQEGRRRRFKYKRRPLVAGETQEGELGVKESEAVRGDRKRQALCPKSTPIAYIVH